MPVFFVTDGEIPGIRIAGALCYLIDLQAFVVQKPLCLLHSHFGQVFGKGLPGSLLEQLPQVIGADVQFRCYIIQRKLQIAQMFSDRKSTRLNSSH